MKTFLENVKKMKYEVVDGEKIKQTQRNSLKQQFLNVIQEYLPKEIVVGRAREGIVLELSNNELGGIPITLDIKIKGLDYDTLGAVEEYKEYSKEKERKKKEKEAKKREKIKQDKKKREQGE